MLSTRWETSVEFYVIEKAPVAIDMSIRRYFKPTNQIPDPRGWRRWYGYFSFAARSATSSIDAHLHAPRATCKNIFVQFDFTKIVLHKHFFHEKLLDEKKANYGTVQNHTGPLSPNCPILLAKWQTCILECHVFPKSPFLYPDLHLATFIHWPQIPGDMQPAHTLVSQVHSYLTSS